MAEDKKFVRHQDAKDAGERFPLALSFSCAWQGIKFAFTGRNMRIHGAIAALVIIAGFLFIWISTRGL